MFDGVICIYDSVWLAVGVGLNSVMKSLTVRLHMEIYGGLRGYYH